MNETLQYYDRHAAEFIADTLEADLTKARKLFLSRIYPGIRILDLGCGSGRDTKYFDNLYDLYLVYAADGSEEMCRLARENIGRPVHRLQFNELDFIEEFAGIWACASLLHLPHAELLDALRRIELALKPGGTLYASFKYGEFSGLRHGRYYSDFTRDSFDALVRPLPQLTVDVMWVSHDVRPGREQEKWLNVLMSKR